MNIHQKNDSDETPGLPKNNSIIYLPELPPVDEVRFSEGTKVAAPAGEKDEYNVYEWQGRWVYAFTFYKSYPATDALNSAYLYLVKALNRLEQAAAVLDVENEELLLTLGRITKDVARAKRELGFDVIVNNNNHRGEKEDV